MKETRFFYAPDAATNSELPQEEAQHAIKVLRLVEGDDINLMDGKGVFYHARVTMAHGKHCRYEILESFPQSSTWKGNIHIAMAPTKMMDRVEWMVEKSTEIGCDEFSFLLCQFSERKQLRTDRIEKIVVSAMKQSHKAWKPIVNELTSFNDFLKQERKGHKFICHCYDEVERVDLFDTLKQFDDEEDITILIGPEGDFSIDEVRTACRNGFVSVSLGASRLRTETAALSSVMMAQLVRRIY